MHAEHLEFPLTTRFVERRDQAIVLDLESKKWVRLPAAGLEAIQEVLRDTAHIEDGKVGGIRLKAIESTIDYLRREGLLVPAEAPRAAPKRPAAPELNSKRTLQLHVTQNCNLACTTCYVAEFLLRAPDPLGLEDIRRIFAAAVRGGFNDLVVTGGEPLLRKDIIQILEAARPLFPRVRLNSNGMALTEKLCQHLAPLADFMNVSLDGATPEINDAIRGEGTFHKTLRGIENLRRSGFPMRRLSINPTVTRLNHHNLEDLLDVTERLGTQISFGFFMPTGRGLCNADRLTLSSRGMLALFERAAAKRKAQLGIPPEEDPEMAMADVSTDCHIGSILTVQSDGSIYPCPNLNQPEHSLGNTFELSPEQLEDVFREPAAKQPYVERVVDRVPGCKDCDCRYFCGGGCMANAYMVSGDIYAKDPYCAFYKAMWHRHGPLRDEIAGPSKAPLPRRQPELVQIGDRA